MKCMGAGRPNDDRDKGRPTMKRRYCPGDGDMPLHIDLVFWPLFALQALEHGCNCGFCTPRTRLWFIAQSSQPNPLLDQQTSLSQR